MVKFLARRRRGSVPIENLVMVAAIGLTAAAGVGKAVVDLRPELVGLPAAAPVEVVEAPAAKVVEDDWLAGSPWSGVRDDEGQVQHGSWGEDPWDDDGSEPAPQAPAGAVTP